MSLTISPERIVEESGSPLLAAPDSWPRRPLGSVATILNGFAFKSTLFVAEGGKPLIRIRDIFSDRTAVGYLGEYEVKYLVQPDELLIGMDGDFNSARWQGPEGLLNQRVCKITPDPARLDLDYLTHILPGYLQAIHDLTSSTTVTHLSSRDIAQIPIPVPPLEEQQALARVFDASASKQDSASGHLVTARRSIERLRQAVLVAACSGRLTADWRQRHEDVASADELVRMIEQHRRGIHRRYTTPLIQPPDEELPPSWCCTTVGALTDVATGATPLRRREDYYGGSIPWVTSGAVNAGLITEAAEHITELAIRETNAKVFPPGTLLVAMYGEGQTRGRVAELGISAATNQAVAALLFDSTTEFLRPYIKLFFLKNYERIRALSFGGVQPNLNLGAIRDTVLPLPPRAEQEEIVQRVSELLKITAQLDDRIKVAASCAEHSRQAILVKAFRGELIAPAVQPEGLTAEPL